MENFNKLVPIDGENGEKRTISSLQIAEITGKAYCGVLKVIRKMDIMCVKITMKNIFFIICLFEKMLYLCSATVLLSYSDWGFFMPNIEVLLKI